MRTQRPRVGIPVDIRAMGDDIMHAVSEKYIAAVAHCAEAMPVLLPALGAGKEMTSLEGIIDPEDMLHGLDGLFLTGSPSNLAPSLYGATSEAVGPLDPQRDATTLPLLRAALAQDMPVLAVCRGFQELNVACGGTLHPAVHELPGHLDHRDDHEQPRELRYAPAHAVALTPNGRLEQLVGQREVQVNSLHGQGIATLGNGLMIEATAPDGLVEATSMPDYSFVIGVQWHPEWQFGQNPMSRGLFSAFGAAARRSGSH